MAELPRSSLRHEQLALVLESLKADPPRAAGGAFRFSPGGAAPLEGEARLDGEWLGLRGLLPSGGGGLPGGAHPVSFWDLLCATHRLPGGAKLALDQNGGAPLVAAEVHLEAATDPARRIADALAGLRSGAARLRDGRGGRQPAPARDPGPDRLEEGASRRIRELCEEAGWPFEERSGGRLCSRLEGPAPVAADLEATPEGAFRVRVELALLRSDLEEACREALGRYLLSVNGCLRLAWVGLRWGPRGLAASLEVSFDSLPSPGELAIALSAASVGHDLCAAETRILASDEECARMFLVQRGPFENPKEVSCPPVPSSLSA